MDMENPDQFNAVFVSNVLRAGGRLAARPVRRFLCLGGSVKMRPFLSKHPEKAFAKGGLVVNLPGKFDPWQPLRSNGSGRDR
jgi:hypothetical protein